MLRSHPQRIEIRDWFELAALPTEGEHAVAVLFAKELPGAIHHSTAPPNASSIVSRYALPRTESCTREQRLNVLWNIQCALGISFASCDGSRRHTPITLSANSNHWLATNFASKDPLNLCRGFVQLGNANNPEQSGFSLSIQSTPATASLRVIYIPSLVRRSTAMV